MQNKSKRKYEAPQIIFEVNMNDLPIVCIHPSLERQFKTPYTESFCLRHFRVHVVPEVNHGIN